MNQFARHTVKNGVGGTNGSVTPFVGVEAHEEESAKEFVENAFKIASKGKPLELRPTGFMVALKIHIRPEQISEITTDTGEKVTLVLPDSVRAEDKFVSSVGLVMALGPQAYKGNKSDGSPIYLEPWARVGSYVLFPRGEGYYVTYRGVSMVLIPDDRIIAVVNDPADVATGSPEYKI